MARCRRTAGVWGKAINTWYGYLHTSTQSVPSDIREAEDRLVFLEPMVCVSSCCTGCDRAEGRIDMEESVGGAPGEGQSVEVKIKDLTPQSKRVDVMAKCLEVSEAKDIPGRFGNSRRVAEAKIADDTAAVVLSLWDAQIGSVTPEDVIEIKNGYVSLVRGHMRLNVGKYGTLGKTERPLDSVNTDLNMSEKEYEQERRRYGGGGGGPRHDRPRYDRDRGGDRDDDRPKYMNKGRRRF